MRILTFNACALPVLSKDIPARLDRVGKAVAQLRPDIALFQEIFSASHFNTLGKRLPAWPHTFSAAKLLRGFGGGLAIFSKHPLEETRLKFFRFQGPFLRYSGINRFVRKGFVSTWVRGPMGIDFRLIAAHPIADFKPDSDERTGTGVRRAQAGKGSLWRRIPQVRGDPYPEAQRRQLGELKEFLLSLGRDEPVILGGDLNLPPHSPIFKAFLRENRMEDCMKGVRRPSIRSEKFYKVPVFDAPHRRIDYILLRAGIRGGFRVKRSRYVLTRMIRLPGGGLRRLSDHVGVAADLRWKEGR